MDIYVSAPYTSKLDPKTGLIFSDYKEWLSLILQIIENNGNTYVNAHFREAWGAKIETPRTALKNDFESISKTDLLLVADLGDPISSGVFMEIGFGCALKKPIIILSRKNEEIPYLLNGIHEWTTSQIKKYSCHDDLVEILNNL